MNEIKFVIPSAPDAADALCSELGAIATAAEWKRAALVYARVRVGTHGGDRKSSAIKDKSGLDSDDGRITPAEYASRQVHGLKSKMTVRRYWHAWDNAITEGLAEPVSLGDEVELPDAEWADYYTPVNPATSPLILEDEPPAEQSIDSDLTPFESGSYLGQGNCPPMASDLDKGEQDSRAERLRDMLANSRAEEDEEVAPEFNTKMFELSLKCADIHAQRALKELDYIKESSDPPEFPEDMPERIESIRAALTAIEHAARGESE